jgi:hypothetical protein
MGLAPRPLARPVGLLALGTLRAELVLSFCPLRADAMIGAGPDMCSRLTRLFWVALDRLDYAVTRSTTPARASIGVLAFNA